jgi:serine/threonine-protein kinase
MLRPGRVVAGRYRIDSILGRGGMGVVAAGLQLDLERPVAIKFLRASLARDARPIRRFAREARAIAKMRSEHVVRVFDVAEEDGVPFIVMERLHGCDLAAELTRGPLPVALTVEYVLQACEAIAEAHSLGIVHRDLKPSNLFLAEGFADRRTLKVLDFGVSKWLGPAPDLDTPLSTSEGSFIGTPAFVSPEQLTRPESVDGRTDVWALGVVLYQCLSGRLPFEADSVPRLCAQILTAEPRPLASSLGVPEGLEAVILRCLRKELHERYASIAELAQALRPFAVQGSLHLLDSIRSLSDGSAGERATRAAPSGSAGGPTPQTTLIFSHEANRSEKSSTQGSSSRKPQSRLRPLLPLAAAALLIVGVLSQREKKAPSDEKQPQAASVASKAESESPASTPRSAPPPPEPVSTVSAVASADREPAPPRVTAKSVRPSAAPSARKPAASTPSASAPLPSATRPAQSASEPATKVPDALDPAQLYRR